MSELPENLPKWIADHIKLYREDPEKAHMWDAGMAGGSGMLPTLLLTTVGRKSGDPRPLPLIYKKVGDNYVIIASKGGAPAHPAWFLNLEATPACQVQVATVEMTATARVAEGAEREDLWAQLAEVYPPYNAYQSSAGDRQIPVVVLEPS
ncbi:MAG: nitroreductase family deazaflavin-dependent oxidoreductase [Pseudomonadales bacterium]